MLLSRHHDDFRNLHELIKQTGGVHPGILLVRRENNPSRDLSQRGIVHAIAKLLAAGMPIQNQFIILNHSR